MPSQNTDNGPEVSLIQIAASLAGRGQPSSDEYLRRFRRYYRHLAVTYGHRFGHIDLESADRASDDALSVKP